MGIKKFTVISKTKSWSFWIQDYFWNNYFPGLANNDIIQEDGPEVGCYLKIKEYFMEHYGPGYSYIDVGAHIGLSSIMIAMEGVSCHCFEPVEENIELLRKATIENGISKQIKLWPIALFEDNGSAIITIPRNSDNSSLDPDVAVLNLESKITRSASVQCQKFDTIIKGREIKALSIGMIKIDVQGFELEVLYGMPQFLSNCKTGVSLLLEIDQKMLSHRHMKADDIIGYLQGYRFYEKMKIGGDTLFVKE